MFALILESAKLIMMFGLIGTIIVLAHFGKLPAKAQVRSRKWRATASRRSSPNW
jgi:hypothetical protein